MTFGDLKTGATGGEVSDVQAKLTKLGFAPGAIDGVYGPNTEGAVRDFQRSAGITVDGIVGPVTIGAINNAVTVTNRGSGPGGEMTIMDRLKTLPPFAVAAGLVGLGFVFFGKPPRKARRK